MKSMKDKKKKKGGQRAGAGRKPSGRQKEAVTVYTDVSKFGGKEGARMAIYEFLNGQVSLTGKSSFVPLEWPKESHEKVKRSISGLPKPKRNSEPQEQPKKTIAHSTTFDEKGRVVEDLKIQQATPVKPRNLDELKALCPAEITDKFERANWVSNERQKYGI